MFCRMATSHIMLRVVLLWLLVSLVTGFPSKGSFAPVMRLSKSAVGSGAGPQKDLEGAESYGYGYGFGWPYGGWGGWGGYYGGWGGYYGGWGGYGYPYWGGYYGGYPYYGWY